MNHTNIKTSIGDWKLLQGKFPAMRQQVADGHHEDFGKFTLSTCVFTGALWVEIKRPGEDNSEYYSLSVNEVMDSFFANLEAAK